MSNLRAQTLTRPTNTLAADTDTDGDWRQACSTVDPELFFPPDLAPNTHPQVQAAKAVCRSCPALQVCATWALTAQPEFGVAGGMTPGERRAVKRRG